MRRRAASVRPGPDGATRPSRTGLTGATTRSSNSSAPLRPPTSRRAPSARSASREPSRGTSTRIIWPSFVGRRSGGGPRPRARGAAGRAPRGRGLGRRAPALGWGRLRLPRPGACYYPRVPGREVGAFLRASPMFAGLPAKEVHALEAVAREDAYRAREYVFMEGEPARWFCVVKSGRVKILKHSRTGKDVVLELLGPGEPFGGVAVIERRTYPAAAQATEPSVIVKIPQEPLVALAERYPAIIKEMALMVGRRLRDAHDSVKSLAVDPVEARLAATLLRLAREGRKVKQGVELPFHLTRQSLADMAGTTVETTIRVVSRWLKEHPVEDDGARFVLRDLEAFRALTEGTEG